MLHLIPPIVLPTDMNDCSVDQRAKSEFQRVMKQIDPLTEQVHLVWFDVTEVLYESFLCRHHPIDSIYEKWVDRFHAVNDKLHLLEYLAEGMDRTFTEWSERYALHSSVTNECNGILFLRLKFILLTLKNARERMHTAWLGD
jgi:hypothetical protein